MRTTGGIREIGAVLGKVRRGLLVLRWRGKIAAGASVAAACDGLEEGKRVPGRGRW